jgi:hypothetical protein
MYQLSSTQQSWRAVMPNPSLKLSPNGVAHWARGAGASPHFAPQSQRATPSGPP